MATYYRIVVEDKRGGDSGGRSTSTAPSGKKTTAKGKWVSIFGGERGGVEHNRKMRAINPLLNKATMGYWEKGMRVGRAGLGLVKRNTETGKIKLSAPAVAILIAFVINTYLKIHNHFRQIANKQNTQNYKAMENGYSAVHGEFTVVKNFWSGRITYNENK